MAYDYARRNQLRQEKGWRSYSQYRAAQKEHAAHPELRDSSFAWSAADAPSGEGEAGDEDEELYAAWYRAFRDKKERSSKAVDSPKAKWFVEVTGKVPSYNEWEARYLG